MGGGRGDSVGWGSLVASGGGRASGVGWGSLAGGVRTGGGHSDVGQEGMLPNGREAVDMGLTGVERDRRHDMARERAVVEGEAGQGGDRKAGRDREAEADQEKGRGVEMEREGEGPFQMAKRPCALRRLPRQHVHSFRQLRGRALQARR